MTNDKDWELHRCGHFKVLRPSNFNYKIVIKKWSTKMGRIKFWVPLNLSFLLLLWGYGRQPILDSSIRINFERTWENHHSDLPLFFFRIIKKSNSEFDISSDSKIRYLTTWVMLIVILNLSFIIDSIYYLDLVSHLHQRSNQILVISSDRKNYLVFFFWRELFPVLKTVIILKLFQFTYKIHLIFFTMHISWNLDFLK